MTENDRNDMIADELMLRDEIARRNRAEEATEYDGHDRCTPMASKDGCVVCDNHDNLTCARGRHCVVEGGAPIGEWIGSNDIGHPTNESALTFEYRSLPGVLFCEDCCVDIETHSGLGDPVLEGKVDDLHWYVHADADGLFYGRVEAYDRTGGLAFERELDTYDSLGEAVVYARTEAERMVASEAASEVRSLARIPS